MRRMIEETLADELAVLPKAWLVPFGPNALRMRVRTALVPDSLNHHSPPVFGRVGVLLGVVGSVT
jgi:hypothetical protein